MNKKLLTGIVILILCISVMGNKGCTEEDKQYYKEQDHTVANQARLTSAQPPVDLEWSLERDQINKRTKLWNDPNKVSYIYLVNFGKVMAFYVIKGKVSSVNSQVTNTQQVIRLGSSPAVIPSPAEDGSYGTNGEGIFFFTTEGAYVEWRGDYMLSDQPLKLTQQPEMIRVIK
jgi:hypothetical protein